MNNKKLIFVANTAWSMFNFRHGLLTQLINSGCRVIVIAPPDSYSKNLSNIGCEVIDLIAYTKEANPIIDIKMMWTLYRTYNQIKPDLIIHYTIKPNIYGSIAARLAGIPSLAITTGLGYAFINDNYVAKIARLLYKLAFYFPNEVWFLNDDDRQEFLKRNLIKESKASLLNGEGIDLDHFSPVSVSKKYNDKNVCFLMIARMIWDKGVGEYVDAARLIKKKYPNVSFRILGDCDFSNPRAINQEYLLKWDGERVIDYMGSVFDVRHVIAKSDCVVLPSYREGIPRALLEAAAMAKPLIATNVPGCRDVIIDGRTGVLCQPKDVESLASAFELIINSSIVERYNMGKAGRAFMFERFDERLIIKKYFEVLNKYMS
ncbi:glycosyltransferase family 4 protein [Aeromonas enteropelogenes]|uniref:glycosyltransferase family 4 protein n=1 Tax=Aeromonas enteropelogenes TaxID=29489 RepID=UPI001CE26782|nr:glycosyltransferase family 4 protein [Aeromonas enteropelogenes]UCA10511.1 glycosyltransferase family 4 protein [Aeromonas enteropelogenes]